MCGIFGVIGKRYSPEEFNASLDLLSHRGPDSEGVFTDGKVSLGFKRLSIIDLSSKGNQPMANEKKDIWLVFNGEIYNFKDLRKLLSKNHLFRSQTDGEVLIHGYEEWGMDGLLERINGMYAFCLYDQKEGFCYFARDRIGKKPLYYFLSGENIFFSSEVKAFLSIKNAGIKINQDVFELQMGFPFLPDNKKTIFKNVFKVMPASYIKFNCDSLVGKEIQYWEPKKHPLDISLEESVHDLDLLITDCVKKRLISDVPLGILLSGGLDSSLITALSKKFTKNDLKTITIVFPGSAIDESVFARKVAEYCRVENILLKIEVDDAYRKLKEKISIYDDLSTFDSGLFSTYLLCSAIRERGIKVLLSGEGADELFGGYSWFKISRFPFSVFSDGLKTKLYYYSIMRTYLSKYMRDYSMRMSDLLLKDEDSYFRKIQNFEIFQSLPNHYCMKIDKGSSAASVEVRCPYLDYRMVEYVLKTPEKFLLKSSSNFYPGGKYCLRKVGEKYLPKNIAWRRKKGGMFPVYDILNNGLKNDKEIIFSNCYLNQFFGKNFLQDLVDSNPKFPINRWQREWILWRCLVFSLWFEYFYKKHA